MDSKPIPRTLPSEPLSLSGFPTPRITITSNALSFLPLWTLQFLLTLTHFCSAACPLLRLIPALSIELFLLPSAHALIAAVLVYEVRAYRRRELTPMVYVRVQFLKIVFLELALLATFTHITEPALDASTIGNIIGQVGLSRIPFLLGPVCAWSLWDPEEEEKRSDLECGSGKGCDEKV